MNSLARNSLNLKLQPYALVKLWSETHINGQSKLTLSTDPLNVNVTHGWNRTLPEYKLSKDRPIILVNLANSFDIIVT